MPGSDLIFCSSSCSLLTARDLSGFAFPADGSVDSFFFETRTFAELPFEYLLHGR